MITFRICLLTLLGATLQLPAETFVVPSSSSTSSLFGIVAPPTHHDHHTGATPATSHAHNKASFVATLPTAHPRGWSLFAKKGTDDDDWEEPSEEDLAGGEFEDISVEDADVEEIEDQSILVVSEADEDDEDAVVEEEDEDLDDDDVDVDLDAWDEDEDAEGITEEYEVYDEETPSTYMGTEGHEEWYYSEEEEEIPLKDDPEDSDYMAQKKLVEETISRRQQVEEDKNFNAADYIMNHMTKEQADAIENWSVQQEVNRIGNKAFNIDREDLEGVDMEEAMASTPDLMDDDPYEDEGEQNILGTGINDGDLKKLDEAWKTINKVTRAEPWDKITHTADTFDVESLANETRDEMNAALLEIGGSAYNCTRWLIYDLNFNVSNLILAAVKHNPEAPILFQHWYPQLMTYERYQMARDRDFNFTWVDVENADMEELERYYLGFGYTEIPDKAPVETGIISFEDLDEDEIKMAAFENWMNEVYNPEWDRKDFDDDSFRDEDNVFSPFFEDPQHPDLPTFEDTQEDLEEWEEEAADEPQAYREFMGKNFEYTNAQTEEFEREFRGHVVIACCPLDEDLEIAEKITAKMVAALGEQVFVETRVIAHAREEDAVFEVWLESYDIDLLHSKKRASSGSHGWTGPVECDDAQIEYLVEEVRFLISDDARYSYRVEEEEIAA